jgi:SPP1 family predicted phage head-tail adaptor
MAYYKNNINPGILSHKITFKTKPTTRDDYGQITGSWTDFKTVSANIMPITGRSFWQGQATQSEISHEVRIRYIAGITPAMRIYFGTRKFEITHVINEGEKNAWLTVYCKEVFAE